MSPRSSTDAPPTRTRVRCVAAVPDMERRPRTPAGHRSRVGRLTRADVDPGCAFAPRCPVPTTAVEPTDPPLEQLGERLARRLLASASTDGVDSHDPAAVTA